MALLEYLSSQISNLNTITTDITDQPTMGSRYIGGHGRTNQPFISGYHHIVFPVLPGRLFVKDSTNTETPPITALNTVEHLTCTCEGFTPHSSNINFIDVNGIGQLGSSFPVSRTINREFTLTFREYQSLPILNIFRTWNALFDPHLGITTLPGKYFIPTSYKGCCMVAIVKPTAKTSTAGSRLLTANDFEEIYMYEGVFPTGVPEDTITAADQATNESVLASVTFKFDGAPLTKKDNGVTSLFLKQIGNAVDGAGINYAETLLKVGNGLV